MGKYLIIILIIFIFCSTIYGQEHTSSDSLRIQSVNIEGNFMTSHKMIYREVVFKLNKNVNRADIESYRQTSINNLNKTALFNFIEINTVEETPGLLAVNVILTERWFIWPTAFLNHTDRNFSDWWKTKDLHELEYGVGLKINNFRGMGESVELKYHIGSLTRREFEYKGIHLDKSEHHFLSLHTMFNSYKNLPWAIDSNKQVILESKQKLLNTNFVEIKYTYRKQYFNFHTVGLSYTFSDAADTIVALNPDFFGFSRHRQRYFQIGYTFTRDTRDSKFYPKTGYLLVAAVNKKGLGLLNGEHHSTDIYLQFYGYKKLAERIYGASGFLCTATTNDNHVFYTQTGLGYLQFVRGYEYYVANGDKSFLLKNFVNFELLQKKVIKADIWPVRKAYQFNKIPVEVFANLFFDTGYVTDRTNVYKQFGNTLVNKLMYSTGVGIDFITYYDRMLRFDYSFNGMGQHGLFIHWKAAIR